MVMPADDATRSSRLFAPRGVLLVGVQYPRIAVVIVSDPR
jgi:hypothetical protein